MWNKEVGIVTFLAVRRTKPLTSVEKSTQNREEPINLATEAMHDHYCGAFGSELEYAIHFFNNHYLENTPKEVQDSIDYTLFREAIFNHDYFSLEAEGQCHVFSRQ